MAKRSKVTGCNFRTRAENASRLAFHIEISAFGGRAGLIKRDKLATESRSSKLVTEIGIKAVFHTWPELFAEIRQRSLASISSFSRAIDKPRGQDAKFLPYALETR